MLFNTAEVNGEAGGPRVRATSLDIGHSKRIFPSFGLELDEQYQ